MIVLGSLRYATYMSHIQEQERKKMARATKAGVTSEGTNMAFTTQSRSTSTQTDGGQNEAVLAELASSKGSDAGEALVSLG